MLHLIPHTTSLHNYHLLSSYSCGYTGTYIHNLFTLLRPRYALLDLAVSLCRTTWTVHAVILFACNEP
jgi:hypothetical protein